MHRDKKGNSIIFANMVEPLYSGYLGTSITGSFTGTSTYTQLYVVSIIGIAHYGGSTVRDSVSVANPQVFDHIHIVQTH